MRREEQAQRLVLSTHTDGEAWLSSKHILLPRIHEARFTKTTSSALSICANVETETALRRKRESSLDEVLLARLQNSQGLRIKPGQCPCVGGCWRKALPSYGLPPGLSVQWNWAFSEGHEDTTLCE